MMRYIRILLLLLAAMPVVCQATSKGLLFFYRLGERVDRHLLSNVDTSYIGLPEHSWRFALTGTTVGIHSYYRTTEHVTNNKIALIAHTTPSADIGFYAGYRGLGFGYSWDVMHAYAQKFNITLGSKSVGIEFQRQVSTNISGKVIHPDNPHTSLADFPKGWLRITNTNVTLWYALNSEHYSHNAAIKQSYIQKKSAGSLLVSLSYLYTDMKLSDDFHYSHTYLIEDVKHIVLYQVAAGIGYGINYTPNHGKVVLHASANAQLVCYSINQLSLATDSLGSRALREPMYNIKPKYPVHVTGNMRAAVSWEINKWVHMTLWGKASNIRFRSKNNELADVRMRNWNWQVHLDIGIRLGAGKKRVREALADEPVKPLPAIRASKLPKWITDYFYSPSL